MAEYKVVNADELDTGLTLIANTIRKKLVNFNDKLSFPEEMVEAISMLGEAVADPPLPEGYTRLDYIQSSGTQYINTGVIATTSVRSVIDLEWHIQPTDDGILAAKAGNNRLYLLWRSSGSLGVGCGDYVSVGFTVSNNVRYVFETSLKAPKINLSCNNVNIFSRSSSASFNLGIPLYLFANNADGTAGAFSKIRLYKCYLYQDENLVRYYVPCINTSGEVGLYDFVTETFFGNDGTGVFVAGQFATETDYQEALSELGVDV